MGNIWLAFITGLTTGGLSCMAVQGGLLATAVSQKSEGEKMSKMTTVLAFLAAKALVYTVLGFALGALGSFISLSVRFQGILQIFVGVFMLATVARLLDLHPVFRRLVIQPPSWVYRLMKRNAKSASLFAPVSMGLLTVLMPCGVTQAMMVVAMGSGSPLLGAMIMLSFTLGTSPLFLTLGLSALKALENKRFQYVAALTVLVFAVMSINGGLVQIGSIYNLQNFYDAAKGKKQVLGEAKINTTGEQEAVINVTSGGYTTNTDVLKAGVPVRLTLNSQNVSGCARAFTIPSLNISKVLPQTGTETIEFTPTKSGKLAFSCSMGMYTGSFDII